MNTLYERSVSIGGMQTRAPERPVLAVGPEQLPRLGDVEGAVGLETPGVQAHRQLIGIGIVAREIEVDHTRKLLPQEEDVVGE